MSCLVMAHICLFVLKRVLSASSLFNMTDELSGRTSCWYLDVLALG